MGKPNPRKLQNQRHKARPPSKLPGRQLPARPQPYPGNKYKSDEFVGPIFLIEQAVYLAFVAGRRQATDHDVRRFLEREIRRLRGGAVDPAKGKDLFSGLIEQFLPRELQLDRDDMIGVLRMLLGSIDVWGTPSPNSRGYLSFLEGFMRKAGVDCQRVTPPSTADAPQEEELLSIGRAWCSGETAAGPVYRALAEQLIADGHYEQVAETCQQLIGEGTSTAIFRELSLLAVEAQRHLALPPVEQPGTGKLAC
jgi:hypothetical protein